MGGRRPGCAAVRPSPGDRLRQRCRGRTAGGDTDGGKRDGSRPFFRRNLSSGGEEPRAHPFGKDPVPEHLFGGCFLEERFDKIFAVNVNVFWLKPEKELAVIRNLLAPGGRLYLFYEPPFKAQGARAEAECRRNLTANRFEVEEVRWADLPPHAGLCLIAAPAI